MDETRDADRRVPTALAADAEARFFEGARYASEFFMGDVDVVRALEKLSAALDEAGIPYAIAGAMALNQYGMSAPHRLKDLADVLELIRAAKLSADFGERLEPYVRAKFDELWHAAQNADRYE